MVEFDLFCYGSQNTISVFYKSLTHDFRTKVGVRGYILGYSGDEGMYVCIVITFIARVWINRVRLPILLVVS